MLLHIFAGALALAIALPAAHAQGAGSLDPAFNPNVPPLADDIDPYTPGLGSWSSVGMSDSILSDDVTVQEILATIPAGATDAAAREAAGR